MTSSTRSTRKRPIDRELSMLADNPPKRNRPPVIKEVGNFKNV
jgi:hypothetical protein